jgi:hypothetical protein
VNKRTGRVVSGHQRLNALDALEGTQDYHLDVTVVDLTEKEEREQNVFLNAGDAQGAFDEEMLGKLLAEAELDVERIGLDVTTIEDLLSGTEWALPEPEVPEKTKKAFDDAAKAKMKAYKDKTNTLEGEPTVVLCFPDLRAAQQFVIDLGLDENDLYVDGTVVHKLLKDAL